jgi:hypothetical protein
MAEGTRATGIPQQGTPAPTELLSPNATLPVELWRSILLCQLGECWNDVRNIDGLVWQIPAGIGAILGLILSGLGARVVDGRPDLLDVGAMFAVVLISSALIVALHKNRMFQVSRNIYMKAIYKQLLATNIAQAGALVPIGLNADDSPMEELPGFVPRATRDLTALFPQGTVQSLPQLASLSDRVRNLSAYKTMFRVSLLVLVGELALAIWLLVRFILQI